jgi:hypothetical protein
MTLHDLIAQFPHRFYPQAWYNGHAFMSTPSTLTSTAIPALKCVDRGAMPEISAVDLAQLYINTPDHPIWEHYLWCSDVDDVGQRIYVGTNGHGFEIHRHLHLTSRWGTPSWT